MARLEVVDSRFLTQGMSPEFQEFEKEVLKAYGIADKVILVPPAGIEPALREETDFESAASTNSAKGAHGNRFKLPE